MIYVKWVNSDFMPFRKSTAKKRKATGDKDGSSKKKSKKVVDKLHKNDKDKKSRKRPKPSTEGGDNAAKKSSKRPRIGNLECGRFPKAFATQVCLLKFY